MALRKDPPQQATLEYIPRNQFIPFHQRTERWCCIVAHRRAGKTVACVNELVLRAIYTKKKNARYGYLAPFRQQAKMIAWSYLKDSTQDMAIEIRESDLSVELPNGAKISLFGSDNIHALRGLYFDGVILDEMADMRPALWAEVILPTLADRRGWAVCIGTPRGKGNQFYDFAQLSQTSKDWYHLTLRADTSKILPEDELQSLREQMSEAQFDQEFLVSFTAAIIGTYYAQIIQRIEQQGQVKDIPYDPIFPVTVAMDLGFTDSTVMWFFQEKPDGIAFIDVHEAHSEPLQHYFDTLDAKPYPIERIWLPHDARARTLQTGKSTAEQFIEHYKATKTIIDLVPQLSVQDGIDAVRLTLPYCWFDQTRCQTAIESLRMYRRKWNELLQRFDDKPLHDYTSHTADAMRYAVLVADKKRLKPPDPITGSSHQPYPSYSLDQLYAERDSRKGSRISKTRM